MRAVDRAQRFALAGKKRRKRFELARIAAQCLEQHHPTRRVDGAAQPRYVWRRVGRSEPFSRG